MANFKRKKPRRAVRCVLCTPGRQGNSAKAGYGKGARRHRHRWVLTAEERDDGRANNTRDRA